MAAQQQALPGDLGAQGRFNIGGHLAWQKRSIEVPVLSLCSNLHFTKCSGLVWCGHMTTLPWHSLYGAAGFQGWVNKINFWPCKFCWQDFLALCVSSIFIYWLKYKGKSDLCQPFPEVSSASDGLCPSAAVHPLSNSIAIAVSSVWYTVQNRYLLSQGIYGSSAKKCQTNKREKCATKI